jgi:ketosteroid isomerase-like protein
MSKQNVELARRAFEAAFRKPEPDFDTINSLFHPDHELVSMVSRPGKSLRGGRGFREWLSDQNEAWASWQGTVGEVSAVDDDRVLVVVDFIVEGKHSGLPYEQRTAVLVTVRDGKLARSETYMSAEAALEAARHAEPGEPASNVDAVRRVYAEWSRGNIKAGVELFDPEIVFESFAPISNQRVIVHGPAAVEAWLRDFLAPVRDYRIFGEKFTEVGEDKVLVQGHHSSVGRHSGVATEAPIHSVWTFRDGKVIHLVWDPDVQKALAAACMAS